MTREKNEEMQLPTLTGGTVRELVFLLQEHQQWRQATVTGMRALFQANI